MAAGGVDGRFLWESGEDAKYGKLGYWGRGEATLAKSTRTVKRGAIGCRRRKYPFRSGDGESGATGLADGAAYVHAVKPLSIRRALSHCMPEKAADI